MGKKEQNILLFESQWFYDAKIMPTPEVMLPFRELYVAFSFDLSFILLSQYGKCVQNHKLNNRFDVQCNELCFIVMY